MNARRSLMAWVAAGLLSALATAGTAAAPPELAAKQQEVRALSERIDRSTRNIREIRGELAERVQRDEGNYQRWSAEIRSDIEDLSRKAAATTYFEEKKSFQRQIDKQSEEQARLRDIGQRWQQKLTEHASVDVVAENMELRRLTDELEAARQEEARLAPRAPP